VQKIIIISTYIIERLGIFFCSKDWDNVKLSKFLSNLTNRGIVLQRGWGGGGGSLEL